MAILLSYRLRILAATMATFSLGTRAHAIPTELNFFTPTAFPQNNTNVFQFFNLPTDLTLDIAVISLLVLIVLVILVKGFRRHQKLRYQFDLFLVLGIDTSACQIWI